MKKTFIIILIICLTLCTAIGIYVIQYRKTQMRIADENNKVYEEYAQDEIFGTDLITLINKTMDKNDRNLVDKENGMYVENDTNSIKIDVKFKESDDIIPMEKIAALGQEQFIKFYNISSFKCTTKKYHKLTNNIEYMLFEEI